MTFFSQVASKNSEKFISTVLRSLRVCHLVFDRQYLTTCTFLISRLLPMALIDQTGSQAGPLKILSRYLFLLFLYLSLLSHDEVFLPFFG